MYTVSTELKSHETNSAAALAKIVRAWENQGQHCTLYVSGIGKNGLAFSRKFEGAVGGIAAFKRKMSGK